MNKKSSKYNFQIIVKKSIAIGLIVFIVPILSTVLYQYFNVIFAEQYDPQKVTLNYEITGQGEKKLVLLHGLGGSLNYWKQDIQSITKTHKLLLIDLLGFGDSPKPNSDYSLKTQMIAVDKVIQKEGFDSGNTTIVGHSMGAIIALALLNKHLNWFQGAVLISTPVYANRSEFMDVMSKNTLFDQLAVGRHSRFFCMLHPLFMVKALKPDNLTDKVFNDAKKHNWQSYYNSLNEIILNTDLSSFTQVPFNKKVIFIHGKKDRTAPYDNAYKFAQNFKNVDFITVNEYGHHLFLRKPDTLWDVIKKFDTLDNIN